MSKLKQLRPVLLFLAFVSAILYYEYDSGNMHRYALKHKVLQHDTTVVFYHTDWCGWCAKADKMFTRMTDQGVIQYIKVDIEKENTDKHWVLTPYVPVIAVYAVSPDGSRSGLYYYGGMPATKEEFERMFFAGTEFTNENLIKEMVGDEFY